MTFEPHIVHSGELAESEARYPAPWDAEALAFARKLRAGQVHLNGAGVDFSAPFGGYKKSGNGREWGREGVLEFLECKALMVPA